MLWLIQKDQLAFARLHVTMAPQPAPAATALADSAEILTADLHNPSRRIAFFCALIVVFLRVSMMHQTLSILFGVNLYVLYVFSLPAVIGLLVCRGVQRTFRGRPSIYWMGFAIWMAIDVPFSIWRGGSFPLVYDYFRVTVPILFMVAGLVLSWQEFRWTLWATAIGGLVLLVSSQTYTSENARYGSRFGLQMGTISNPNDFAGHLIFVLPFLVWGVLATRNILVRLVLLGGIGYSVLLVVKTASRGAALGLVLMAVYYLLRAPLRQKVAIAVFVPVCAALVITLAPPEALRRIMSFKDSSGAVQEAVASQEARTYLFQKSLDYTLQFPIFGIGPGEFSTYEVFHSEVAGMKHGLGFSTHSSYTQASAECGIPGFLLFVAGLVSSYLFLNKVYRDTKDRPELRDLRMAAFCIMLSLVSFALVIGFLNFAYFFYEPFYGGLAIALARAAKEEIRTRPSQPANPPAPFPPPAWTRLTRVTRGMVRS